MDKLKKRLYRGNGNFDDRVKRKNAESDKPDIKTYWQDGISKKPLPESELRGTEDLMGPKIGKKKKTIILTLAFAFLAFAVVVALGISGVFSLGNIVSSRNIDMVIEGSPNVESGVPTRWRVLLTNKNESKLELADLIIDYPLGSLSVKGENVSRERRAFGEILPGQTRDEEVALIFVGQEDDQKEVVITLEYRVEGSNAIFAKTETKTARISRSPVGISFNMPQETDSGQEIAVEVECVSNSSVALKDVLLKIEYPPGFQFLSAEPEPYKDKNSWLLGDLNPQEKRSIKIKGILEGQDMSEANFRASVGVNDDDASLLGSAATAVLIKKPFLNLGFLVNGKDIESISGAGGKSLSVSIPWQNNLPDEVRDVSIKVVLKSEAVDFRTLSVQGGDYSASGNSIVWNSSSFNKFAALSPGDEGVVDFSFLLKNVFPVNSSSDRNFSIKMEAEMSGTRNSESGESSVVKSIADKEIKISSELQLAAKVLRGSGPFANTGPLPPKVGEATTYTVVFSVSNLYNDVRDAVVRAVLPSYISWTGTVSPSDADISFNSSTGEVFWKLGVVEAGTGLLKPAKEAAFKISFTPALNQMGSTPTLVSQISLEGRDTFTDLPLRDSANDLDIGSISEVQANQNLGKVSE